MRKDLYQSILNAQKNNVDTESGIPTQSRRVYGRSFVGDLVGKSQYDKGFISQDWYETTPSDINEYRGQNQPWYDQLGNAGMRTLSELSVGTIKGMTDIPDMLKMLFSEDGMADVATKEFQNEISRSLGETEEQVNEAFPIYRTQHNKGFSPLHFSWWMEGVPSAASTASMFIPIFGSGKIASMIGRYGTKMFTGIKMAKNAEAILSTFVGTTFGNQIETYQQWQPQAIELRDKMIQNGMSEEEADVKIKEEGWKNLVGNLANIPLDMIGAYHMFKPIGGISPLKKDFWKMSGSGPRTIYEKPSVLGTVRKEMIPEAIQESNNYYNQERANRNVDISLGLSTKDYTLSEAMTDPEFWTATAYGGLGSLAFTGASNIGRQVSDNASYLMDSEKMKELSKEQKAKGLNIFSNVGKAFITGETSTETSIYQKQQEILKPIMDNIIKLSDIKNVADMTGDMAVYDQSRAALETEHVLLHMHRGTFGKYMENVDKMQSVLNEQEDYVKKQLEQTPDDVNLQQYLNNIKETKQLVDKSKPELLLKEQDFISAINNHNINDSSRIGEFVRTKSEIRQVKKDMNDALGHANAIYDYDDTTKYLVGTTERMREIQNEIEGLQRR